MIRTLALPRQADGPTAALAYRPRRLPGPKLAASGGPVLAKPAPPGQPEIRFVNRGGLVLSEVHVYLVFWGGAWATQLTPSHAEIAAAARTILASSYTSGLKQYGFVHPGRVAATVLAVSSQPPNPFKEEHIAGLVHSLLGTPELPEPDSDPQALYVVILPPGVRCSDPNVIGAHSYFTYVDVTDPQLPADFDGGKAHYAWATNDGTLDFVTTVFSHELVEACTDAEGTAIQALPGTCQQPGWCEIGDVCADTALVDGACVQSYWSYADNVCVIPGAAAAGPGPAPDPTVATGVKPAPLPNGPAPNGAAAGDHPAAETATAAAPARTPPAPVVLAKLVPPKASDSWVAMLAAIFPAVPMTAVVATVISYATGIPHGLLGASAEATSVAIGTGTAVVAWIAAAIVFRRFGAPELANIDEYGQLITRLQQLKDQLQQDGTTPPAVVSDSARIALQEAADLCALLEDDLGRAGLRWVLAIGYVNAWITLHRAEEDLFLIDPVETVVGMALYDQLRLEGSDVAHADDLVIALRHAVRVLDPKAAALYLNVAELAPPGDADFTDASEVTARSTLSMIRKSLNEYRDLLWAGLARARNQLVETVFVTGVGSYLLVGLLLFRGLDSKSLGAAAVFFTFGALVGLLSRLRDEAQVDKAVEDFGLATTRLIAAPLLAGLAAVFGVLVVGLAHITIGSISLGPQPPSSGALPRLREIFSLGLNPIGFLAAALFGLTPGLLFDYLQAQTDIFRKGLKSSEASGQTAKGAGT